MTHKNQNGFTLVELAIALMVIGLLIGGVLKGQELIENARVTATIRQINAYDTAAMIFKNTYNALPGDIKRPNRIPNCTEEICSFPGNGNGKIRGMDATPGGIEFFNFFPHLTKAGMIQGPTGGNEAERAVASTDPLSPEAELFFPALPSGIVSFIEYGISNAYTPDLSTMLPQRNSHFYAVLMPFKYAEPLDLKTDDGLPCSGTIVLEDTGDCNNGNTYAEQAWTDGGAIFIEAGF